MIGIEINKFSMSHILVKVTRAIHAFISNVPKSNSVTFAIILYYDSFYYIRKTSQGIMIVIVVIEEDRMFHYL